MTVQMRFVINGGYPEAQQWLANKLYAEESKTHMNIQTMRLSGAKAAE